MKRTRCEDEIGERREVIEGECDPGRYDVAFYCWKFFVGRHFTLSGGRDDLETCSRSSGVGGVTLYAGKKNGL